METTFKTLIGNKTFKLNGFKPSCVKNSVYLSAVLRVVYMFHDL